MAMRVEPVTIIGAGPAGLAAAIQLKRYGITPITFERAMMGGLLHNANLVENYPGFPDGVSGPELARCFVAQASRIGVDVTFEAVTLLEEASGHFRVTTPSRVCLSRIVVIATGTRPCTFSDFEILVRLRARVFYEVFPLLGVEGKRIAIVGAGDAAFDYALNLAKKNQVVILNHNAQHKCLPMLWERSQAVSQISYHARTTVSRMSETVSGGITLKCTAPTGSINLDVDYLIGAIGREPQLDFVATQFLERAPELEKRGGLYRIGDVKNGIFRQVSIAVGEGVLAAMKIYRQLEKTLG